MKIPFDRFLISNYERRVGLYRMHFKGNIRTCLILHAEVFYWIQMILKHGGYTWCRSYNEQVIGDFINLNLVAILGNKMRELKKARQQHIFQTYCQLPFVHWFSRVTIVDVNGRRGPRVRQLRSDGDAAMATRRCRPIPVQCVWSLSESQRTESTAGQTKKTSG